MSKTNEKPAEAAAPVPTAPAAPKPEDTPEYQELFRSKVEAGLSREMAREVSINQIEHDRKLEKARKAEEAEAAARKAGAR